MELSEILQKFEKPKKTGSVYNVKCPSHDDKNASLSITEKDGKILLHCHAGCQTKDVISSLGLKMQDLFIENLKEYTKQEKESYIYTDESGNIKHKSDKYFINGKKQFAQYRFENGKWEKGVEGIKKYLYNLPDILKWKHTAKFIAIVEGEKCVDACKKIGVLATTNVAGAGKWEPHLSDWLKDVSDKIVIFQDNDTPGLNHAEKVKKFFPKAKIINLMPKKPKGDIFDWIEQGGTLEQLEHIIFDTDEEGENLERIDGVPFGVKQGDKYILTDDYIYSTDGKIISFTPAIISKSLESIDTGDIKAEILFKKDKNWEKIVVKKSVIATTSNITALSDCGMNINSINAKNMVGFFSDFEMNNNSRIEKTICTSQLGWSKDDEFLPYTNNLVFDADNETMKKYEAYHERGSLEKWIKTFAHCRKNEYFRFYINASFATPLLEMLRERGFFVHLWEDSGAGKTAALKAALSVWGDPDTLMTNFNSTKVAFEKMAALYNDLPMGIDERQQANEEILDSLVYMIVNGKGRARGNKSGGLQTQHIWKTIALTTGEEPLSKETSHTGVKSRLLEIQGKPFDSTEDARKMYDFLKDNYGVIGKIWIEKIKNNRDYIKKKHKEIVSKLEYLKDKMQSHLQFFSIVMLADELTSEWFFKDGICDFETVKNSIKTFDEADVVMRAKDHIHSWIMSNYNSFNVNAKPCFGVIDDSIAYIFPNILEKELLSSGFSSSKIKKKLAERGHILQDNQGRNQIVRRYENKCVRMVAFVLNDAIQYDF